MSDRDPVDTMGPWTIKAVSTHTRGLVNAAAKRENLTVGQWLERRVSEWEEAGSPVPVSNAPVARSDDHVLIELLNAGAAMAAANKHGLSAVPGLRALLAERVGEARGVPPTPRTPTKSGGQFLPKKGNSSLAIADETLPSDQAPDHQ